MPVRLAARSLSFLLFCACVACSSEPAPAKSAPELAFDQTWRISTHNAYWVDRGVPGDLFASGVGERLIDQLIADGARSIELDIHPDPDNPGKFNVYHTKPGNTVCTTLDGCLKSVRFLHRAFPQHEAVVVVLELKEIMAPTFDAAHTTADLDAQLRQSLGAALWTPKDLLKRCPDQTTLHGCAAKAGWPANSELRGKVLVAVLGNWDTLAGAQAPADWAHYASQGPIAERAAFPMGSSWQRNITDLSENSAPQTSQEELELAWQQTVFLQIEALDDPMRAPFLKDHGIVRVDGASTVDDQLARLQVGCQLLQTDQPWIHADRTGPASPLPGVATGTVIDEPENVLQLAALSEPGSIYSKGQLAYVWQPDGASTVWQATLASGIHGARKGCLRAAVSVADQADSVTWCRSKVDALRPAQAPGGLGGAQGGSFDAEMLVLDWQVCRAGKCQTFEDMRDEGDVLGLAVDCSKNQTCCATPRWLVDVTPAGYETWQDAAAPECFAAALPIQGFWLAPEWVAGVSALYAGASLQRNGKPLPVDAAHLTWTFVGL